jgi:Tat protein translocase TatB subunit
MFNIGTQELLVILAIALVVVGPRRLPEISRTIGRVMNELRKVQDEVRDMVKFDLSDDTSSVPDTKPVPTPHVQRDVQQLDLDGPGGEPVEDQQSLGLTELPGRDAPEAEHTGGLGTGVPTGDSAAE